MKKKKFDCVEIKQKAQKIIQKELEGKTVEEQLQYWKEKDTEFQVRTPGKVNQPQSGRWKG